MKGRRKGGPQPLRQTRYERAVELRRTDHSLSSTLVAIDIALKSLYPRIDRALDMCQASSSGSVVGSVVQVPMSDPASQVAYDWLDAVKRSLEELVREAP